MLLQLVHWVWVGLVSLGYGALLVPATEGAAGNFKPIWLRSVTGILLAALVGAVLHFFLPINVWVGLGVGLAGIGLGVFKKAYSGLGHIGKEWPLLSWVAVGLVGGCCLVKACAPSSYTDFGLYYIPTMRWIEHFPLVPGLANLHSRLGFNSLWHMACVVLNPFQFAFALDGLNEYLFLGTVVYFCIDPLANKQVPRRQIALGLSVLVLCVGYTSFFLTSPSPDLAIIFVFWLLADVLLQARGAGKAGVLAGVLAGSSGPAGLALPLFLATALVLVKASALPALVFVGLWVLAQPRWWLAWRLLLLPVCMLGVWVLSTWVLTGYPVFPAPMHLPAALVPAWQVPMAYTELAYVEVKGFARYFIRTQPDLARYSYPMLATMPASQWLPLWASQKLPVDWGILALLAIGALSGAWAFVRRRFSIAQKAMYVGLLAGLVFWFVTAPGIRFSVCYLVPMLMLAMLAGTKGKPAGGRFIKSNPSHKGMFTNPVQLVMVALALLFVGQGIDMRVLRSHKLAPAPWPTVATFASPNGPYTVPAEVLLEGLHTQCWDAPLPCTEDVTHKIKQRGPSLADGFIPAGK